MKIDMALLMASRASWLDNGSPRIGPAWMRWLWTLVFCAVLAVPFTVLGFLTYATESAGAWRNLAGWAEWYGRNLVVCVTIGALIHLTFDVVGWAMGGLQRVRRWPMWRRTLFFSGIPMLCAMLGWPLSVWMGGAPVLNWLSGAKGQNVIVGSFLTSVLLTFFFHQYFSIQAQRLQAEKRATEAQLRLLQGQIEPHFLFNTLANVQALMDHEPALARQMLLDFTEYLRCSLATLRSDEVPLAQELDLAESYLRLLGARMADRLRWTVTADAAARAVQVPPLLLQPLVENAIHHGLEPQLQGGSVQVLARVQGSELVLEVCDDGRGPEAPRRAGVRKGHGLALQNIRERLHSRYGDGASLVLTAAHPGTRVLVRLPLTTPGESA